MLKGGRYWIVWSATLHVGFSATERRSYVRQRGTRLSFDVLARAEKIDARSERRNLSFSSPGPKCFGAVDGVQIADARLLLGGFAGLHQVGNCTAANNPMMATTIMISTSVKPLLRETFKFINFLFVPQATATILGLNPPKTTVKTHRARMGYNAGGCCAKNKKARDFSRAFVRL